MSTPGNAHAFVSYTRSLRRSNSAKVAACSLLPALTLVGVSASIATMVSCQAFLTPFQEVIADMVKLARSIRHEASPWMVVATIVEGEARLGTLGELSIPLELGVSLVPAGGEARLCWLFPWVPPVGTKKHEVGAPALARRFLSVLCKGVLRARLPN